MTKGCLNTKFDYWTCFAPHANRGSLVLLALPRLSGRSQDRFNLAARVDFRGPGGALQVRDRCHQVDPLSAKCHGVKKAHGDVDAGGCQLALLDEMVQPARDFLVGDQLWRTVIIPCQITDAPGIGSLSVF
jgi:hypothetical protein